MLSNVTFADVKRILDRLVSDWVVDHDRPALLFIHGGSFGWSTREKLLQAVAFDVRLIQPELIGASDVSAVNLLVALQTGVAPHPRMPMGGPFATEDDIAMVTEWIKAGAPE